MKRAVTENTLLTKQHAASVRHIKCQGNTTNNLITEKDIVHSAVKGNPLKEDTTLAHVE